MDHLREVAANKRRIIYAKDVCHISVPQFEGLSIDNMLDFARAYPQVYMVLPSIEREIKKCHREFIANIIYTIVGQPFKDWVASVADARNEKIIADQDLQINMDPQIFAVFQASSAVSTQKGISGMIMKANTKRRRGKQEIKDQKAEEEKLEKET